MMTLLSSYFWTTRSDWLMETGKTRQLSTMNERTIPDGIAVPKSMHTLTQLPPTKSIECRCPQREV